MHFPKLRPDAAVSRKVPKTPSKQRPAPWTPRWLGQPGAGPRHTRWVVCCPLPEPLPPTVGRPTTSSGPVDVPALLTPGPRGLQEQRGQDAPGPPCGLRRVCVRGVHPRSPVPPVPVEGELRQEAEWTWHQVPAPRAPPKWQSHSAAPKERLVYATCRIRASAGPAPRGPGWAWSCPLVSAGPPSGRTV